jgi:hypothetical protein
MKRPVLFIFLGPLLGHAIASFIIFPTALAAEGAAWTPKHLLLALITLPYAYIFGLVPALISCVMDYFLKHKPSHTVWTVIFGITFSLPMLLVFAPFSTPNNFVVAACIGGIPAAVCSWLSNDKQNLVRNPPPG